MGPASSLWSPINRLLLVLIQNRRLRRAADVPLPWASLACSVTLSAGALLAAGCGNEETTPPADGAATPSTVAAGRAVAQAPTITGPGLDGAIVIAARRRDGGPAADLYELRGRPLQVRRLTSNSDRFGIGTLNVTPDGVALGTVRPDGTQVVRLYDPSKQSGFGRRVGVGFEGSVGPRARSIAVLRRSSGASGLPLLIAVKSLRGRRAETVVVRERRELGGPAWSRSGELLVPVADRDGSEILVRSETGQKRPSIPLPAGFHASTVLPGPGRTIAVTDATEQASVFVDDRDLNRAHELSDSQVLAWAPDGQTVLVATDLRRRLQLYNLETNRLTRIADLPNGDIYGGAWGSLQTPR